MNYVFNRLRKILKSRQAEIVRVTHLFLVQRANLIVQVGN